MYLECRGTGAPAVLLEGGLGVAAAGTWTAVLPAVAKTTRTCMYDRPGTGSSAPAPGPRTSAVMVRELRALLAAAGVRPPYVVVGASFGGLNAQLLARRAPDAVAGVVLLDALHPAFDRRYAAILGRRAARARARTIAANPEGVTYAGQLASDDEVAAAGPFPSVPLRVLAHGVSFEPGGTPVPRLERLWRAHQRDLAAMSPEGAMEVAPRSHHRIAEDDPDRVVRAVEAVVAEARRR